MKTRQHRRHSRFPAVDRSIPSGGERTTERPVEVAPEPQEAPPEPEAQVVAPIEPEAPEEPGEAVEEARDPEADEGLTAVGGGWYELTDGRRVQGLDNARAALDETDGEGSPING